MGALSYDVFKAANKTRSAWAFHILRVFGFISIPIRCLGLIGNGIVFIFLCCVIQKTKYTIYALNIALADLLNLIFQSVFFFMFAEPTYTTSLLRHILIVIKILTDNAAFFILTAFCTGRCLLMYFPAWSQHHLSKVNSILLCVILWCISCLISVVQFMACHDSQEISLNCLATMIAKIITRLLLFFPTLFMCVFCLFIRTRKREKETPLATVDITITIMSVHFIIFDSAVRICDVIVFSSEIPDMPLISLSVLFDIICSSGNPLIYLLVGYCRPPKAWRGFQETLKRALEENAPEIREEIQQKA